jgi:hypothetical protein
LAALLAQDRLAQRNGCHQGNDEPGSARALTGAALSRAAN